jgi:serine/threonine protein kinase
MFWRNKMKRSARTVNDVQGCNGIIVFRYTDLHRATKNFTDKLGTGSFGSVFKGFINDSVFIAVKRLDGAYQGEKQFRTEVSSIGAVQHINLVKLVGFCCEGSRRLLVYEHMSNRSLDIHLFRTNPTRLNWTARYKIALGVARGLAYLHESCRDCIIHCDIKPENILLDASFLPKIADFGMAKLLGRDYSRVLTTIRGTAGYLAPEWITGVPITPKVDVYSYGMVLLELISGRRNSCAPSSSGGNLDVYFPVHATHKLLEGDVESLLDHKLHGGVDLDEAELVCKVACWCIQDKEFDRPTMGEVVQILEGVVGITMPPIPRLLQAIGGS